MHQMTNKELFTTFLSEEKTVALFNHFKGLRHMARAPHEEFLEVGLDKHDIKQVRAVLELSRKYAARTAHLKSRKSIAPRTPMRFWPLSCRTWIKR